MTNKETTLLDRFVNRFRLEDRSLTTDEVPRELIDISPTRERPMTRWRPIIQRTDEAELHRFYAKLPGRFPRLYESLVLSYRWLEVDVGIVTLLGNPPGPLDAGLFHEMTGDLCLAGILLGRSLIQFAKGPGCSYDPVCFDAAECTRNGDSMILQFDHEAILCDGRLGDPKVVASSFVELVERSLG